MNDITKLPVWAQTMFKLQQDKLNDALDYQKATVKGTGPVIYDPHFTNLRMPDQMVRFTLPGNNRHVDVSIEVNRLLIRGSDMFALYTESSNTLRIGVRQFRANNHEV